MKSQPKEKGRVMRSRDVFRPKTSTRRPPTTVPRIAPNGIRDENQDPAEDGGVGKRTLCDCGNDQTMPVDVT